MKKFSVSLLSLLMLLSAFALFGCKDTKKSNLNAALLKNFRENSSSAPNGFARAFCNRFLFNYYPYTSDNPENGLEYDLMQYAQPQYFADGITENPYYFCPPCALMSILTSVFNDGYVPDSLQYKLVSALNYDAFKNTDAFNVISKAAEPNIQICASIFKIDFGTNFGTKYYVLQMTRRADSEPWQGSAISLLSESYLKEFETDDNTPWIVVESITPKKF
jgi:hypothetical protein